MADRPPALIFLLSPASLSGKRAELLLHPQANFDLARELRSAHGASLGEVFAFLSSLYFRGKLSYARRFAVPPAALPGALIITPGRGLRRDSDRVTVADLKLLAGIDVHAQNRAYAEPLRRDASALVDIAPTTCRFVLLGSIATSKYIEPLREPLGERLLFPDAFVGRGDMSRGGLMLRCAREGTELSYSRVATAVRHGQRPARLPSLRLPTTISQFGRPDPDSG